MYPKRTQNVGLGDEGTPTVTPTQNKKPQTNRRHDITPKTCWGSFLTPIYNLTKSTVSVNITGMTSVGEDFMGAVDWGMDGSMVIMFNETTGAISLTVNMVFVDNVEKCQFYIGKPCRQ